MISKKNFAGMIPTNKEPDVWYDLAVRYFDKYQINNQKRIAAFMAQGGHESSDFKTLEENLNYSAANLRKVFPRYFPTDASAKAAAGKPEVIANIVYDDANRVNKIGNTKTGDGWKFRGGGIFQLTGRTNYGEFGKSIGKTADEAVDYVRTKEGAMESACWFWSKNNLNAVADTGDVTRMTKIINGGEHGLADRRTRYNRNLPLSIPERGATAPLASQTSQGSQAPQSASSTPPTQFKPIGRRMDSDPEQVKAVQKALGIAADGIFGLGSESAVRSWQRTNGFAVTGILDLTQFNKLTNR